MSALVLSLVATSSLAVASSTTSGSTIDRAATVPATVTQPAFEGKSPRLVEVTKTSSKAPSAWPKTKTQSPKVGPLTFTRADWFVEILAQYWLRFIGDSGRDFREGDFAEFFGQRARLGAHVGHANGFGIRVLLQDVRTWGEELDTLGDFSASGFDVQEAFVDVPVFDLGRLRLGRQEVVVDNARLIGNVIWTLRARSLDGVRFDTAWAQLKLMLLYAKLLERDANPDGNVPLGNMDRDLIVAYLTYDFSKQHRLHFNYVADLFDGADVARHTFGPSFTGRVGAFDYRADAFLQFSGLSGASEVSLFLSGSGDYNFQGPWKPQLGVFVDVLSSDGTRAGTFDTLFATNHKFYGEMDLFLNVPVHTAGRGLINPGARVRVTPLAPLTLSLTWHNFLAYASVDGNPGRRFGDEVDLKAIVKVLEQVQLRALYGVFFPQSGFASRFGPSANRVEHFTYVTLAAEI